MPENHERRRYRRYIDDQQEEGNNFRAILLTKKPLNSRSGFAGMLNFIDEALIDRIIRRGASELKIAATLCA